MADPTTDATAVKKPNEAVSGIVNAARTTGLAAVYLLTAGFVGGTLVALVGKPIWIWCNWLWNLY